MEDGCARRRLQFCDQPYKNKTFYIDVKTKCMLNRVSSAITQLGGTVESFLSKDIFMFITDAKTSRLQNLLLKPNQDVGSVTSTDILGSPYSPTTGTDSQNITGVGSQNISVMSRGRALLMKARENSKDSLCTNNSTDSTSVNNGSNSTVMKAFQMRIKIEHAINFLKKCKSIGVNFKSVKKSKNEDLSGFAPLKWDKHFIKVEEITKQYRPIFKQLENLPKLFTDNCGGSPFDGPPFLYKIQSEMTGRKEMKGRKFTQEKGGYCEMCEQWYTKSLKEHMQSSNHVNFVKNIDNFSTLDNLVSELPSVSDFLAKFAPSASLSIIDKNEWDHSPLEIDSSDKSDSALVEAGVSELQKENVLQNPTYTSAKQLFPDKALFPLQVFPDDKLFDNDVLKNDQDMNMFSTDHSQSESPTNVLKDLLINWTLQDSIQPSTGVDETIAEANGYSTEDNIVETTGHFMEDNIAETTGHSIEDNISETTGHSIEDNIIMSEVTHMPVPSDENYSGTTSLYGECTEEPMSVGTPILSLDCDEDNNYLADDGGQMKLKVVYGNGDSISAGHVSSNCQKKCREKKQKLRKVKSRKVKTDIYCSRKTSETKLKLCKVSLTPLQQKCNLKMFWQVRKTGDCKLVFSSKKRKKARENSISNSSGREMDEEQNHPLKRQRLVF